MQSTDATGRRAWDFFEFIVLGHVGMRESHRFVVLVQLGQGFSHEGWRFCFVEWEVLPSVRKDLEAGLDFSEFGSSLPF